jgi:hypothetical protein
MVLKELVWIKRAVRYTSQILGITGYNFLDSRKDNAMLRSGTDDLWTSIESIQHVLFVIFAIKSIVVVMI